MGRIDDALRRSGASLTEPPRVDDEATDVFVSPWGLGTEERAALESPSPPVRVVSPMLVEGFSARWRDRLTISTDADPLLVHQFHRLSASLLQAQRTHNIKSVMIASASPADGKTLTAFNLALVLSGSYRLRVLLIEGDLRRPTVAAAVNLPQGPGLSEALKAGDDAKVPLVQLTDTLTLLPAGRPDPDPLSGLTSPRMQRLLQDATEHFDWVILDTPPVGATADAGLLCPLVDAAILVVRARQTAHAAVQAAIDVLDRDRILGVVLNGVEHDVAVGYDVQYGDYSRA